MLIYLVGNSLKGKLGVEDLISNFVIKENFLLEGENLGDKGIPFSY